jgi:AbrB family looped-hinge helix DNA binding protein
MATVTSKGQVTIPKAMRDALGIRPGAQVEFELEDSRIVIRKRVPEEALRKWQGYLRGKLPFKTTDELILELRGERDYADTGAE